MTNAPPTKADLLTALRSSGREVVETLRKLPPATFEEGRYENGWNARQILAHIAAIEWTYPRLLEIPTQSAAAAKTDAPAATAPAGVRGGIDAYNERQVAKRAGASAAELLTEFRRNRETTIRAVEAADESVLRQPIRSAGGIEGSVAEVLLRVAVDHVLGHLRDILGPGPSV